MNEEMIQNPATRKALLDYPLTDAGNAESFKRLFGSTFCYVPEVGKWFRWTGVVWAPDDEEATLKMVETARIRQKAGLSIEKQQERTQFLKWCLGSESAYRINAALSLAGSMLIKSRNEFDKNPYLLCCANGVVDLRTGKFRPTRPEDYLIRSTNILFDRDASCSRWLAFLGEIFREDQSLIGFGKRAIGYTLTGATAEQVFFMLYGIGANGKSTLLGIIEGILGDYAVTLSATFIKEKRWGESIPNDVARAAGARFVKVIEVKEGAPLNEERIKSITGGDRISARFLHKEFFEFNPAFKLWVAVNHKPVIRGTDEAIWRRVCLIPFEENFPPDKRESHLIDILKKEVSGILNWAIEGCIQWQLEGLGIPEKVKAVSENYREESDIFKRYLKERTSQDANSETSAKDIFENYGDWCRINSEEPINQTAFGREMTRRGFERKQKPNIYYRGLKLNNIGPAY